MERVLWIVLFLASLFSAPLGASFPGLLRNRTTELVVIGATGALASVAWLSVFLFLDQFDVWGRSHRQLSNLFFLITFASSGTFLGAVIGRSRLDEWLKVTLVGLIMLFMFAMAAVGALNNAGL
ncbi:MAG: hypothetical protein AB7J28_17000 [Hyphomonadaceae bacterium]